MSIDAQVVRLGGLLARHLSPLVPGRGRAELIITTLRMAAMAGLPVNLDVTPFDTELLLGITWFLLSSVFSSQLADLYGIMPFDKPYGNRSIRHKSILKVMCLVSLSLTFAFVNAVWPTLMVGNGPPWPLLEP